VLIIHGTADEALPWEGQKNGNSLWFQQTKHSQSGKS